MTALPSQPLSPLDGRYLPAVAALADYLSEAGLNRARVEVEVEWLIALTDRGLFGAAPLDAAGKARLRSLYADFGQAEIDWLAEREAITRHDVKAVEYLVRDRLEAMGLGAVAELTHFACTSEDINSTAYALTVQRAVTRVWLPKLRAVIDTLATMAAAHRDAAMLSRTHGQPATPTTMGKEIGVFAWRLQRIARQIEGSEYLAKFSGATGTWSAHLAAEPDVDWLALARDFIEGLGIGFNPVTTQIESHDWQVELYDRVRHAGGVLHNLATDMWSYISLGYFAQIPVAGATGSSTMPHKINPIRFENAEANLEISGGLLATLAQTLVTSRLQRDLTDSTTQRNIGVALGHSLLALDNLQRGLGEVSLAQPVLDADLEANWEVLAEAIQTVVRAEITAGRSQISDPYALLKDLTRGRRVGAAELAEFVRGLDVGEAARARLLALTPATYTGLAAGLVDLI
ncbi:adenylosuccinate lyase [Caulobacter sp. KR2-114]|uniref:adenylosuccinate lyase n=1 Tax=Caulobacter sp. KR2-114 TaxID=3400912 RepID=UPI003C0B60AB